MDKPVSLIEVRVPALPESVADATLVEWHKKPGDSVRRDENLVDIETDKVVFDTPAPSDGVLTEIRKGDGELVVSNELIGTIEVRPAAAKSEQPVGPATHDAAQPSPRPLSPAVNHLVAEHNLDPARIPATGRNGRLTKEDVLAYLRSREEPALEPAQPSLEQPTVVQARERFAPKAEPIEADEVEARPLRRVPMSRLRARIAERMLEAQQTTATLSTFNEIDMHAVMNLRRRYREQFEKRHGVRLGLMSFFVRACVESLKQYPIVNASVDGADVLYHDYYDIGIAVASPRGLVVPVLRDADRIGQATIEKNIAEFAERAKEGALTIEELTGGTFTITNGGVFGSLLSTPVLNPPQSAILGLHKIQERPVAVAGDVVIRPMMYVALSYDHRIIDGRDAVRFLVTVKELIEDPALMLLEN